MINGSTSFNNAVIEGGHPYTARISENGTIINCDILSCNIVKGSTGNEAFNVGGCFVPYIEVEARELTTLLENKELKLEVGVYTDDTNIEWINIGYFTVTKVESSTVKTTFTGVGRIAAVLSFIHPTLPSLTTIATVISAVQAAVRAYDTKYSSFTINTSTVDISGGEITGSLEGLNARQLLEIVAGCIGGYLTEDNAGNAVIFKYNTASTISYNGNRMIQHPTFSNYDYSLTNIKVIQQEKYELDDGTVVPEVSYIYDSTQPYDWVISNEYMASQSMFNIFCTNCLGLTYRPASTELAYGDPRLEANDVLKIIDTESAEYIVPAFGIVHSITGGLKTTIVAPGKSNAESGAEFKGPLTQQLDVMSSSVQTARIAAASAKASAESAQADATRAYQLASTIEGLAQEAKADASTAQSMAESASKSAQDASTQAGIANVYANSALDQLGIVENIVGVLDLLQKNGDYQVTSDEEVQPSKWYFTRSGTSPNYTYSVVNNPTSVYHLTEDTVIDSSKTYYTRSGTGTTEDPYVYTVVENPVVAQISTYYEKYYEVVGIDQAIQNYVSSQLVVDDNGLWLKTASMQTKVLLSATDGVVLYGTDGTIVGKYGSTAQIGDSAGFHIEMDGTELGFYQGTRKVAYISNNQLYITQSVVLQQMDLGTPVVDGGLGQWSWKIHPNGQSPSRNNLNLKWIG